MKPKSLIIELIVLIATYVAAFFCWDVVYRQLYNNPTSANLYKTYSIAAPSPPIMLVFCTFCLISMLVYLTRAIINRFSYNVVNMILLTFNSLSIIVLFVMRLAVIELERGLYVNGNGWTLYPPLAGPGRSSRAQPHFEGYVFIPIVIFALILVISCAITIKNWKSNNYGQIIK